LGEVDLCTGSSAATARGVFEYSDKSDCIFRVQLSRLSSDVLLSDGTFGHVGDRVIDLHSLLAQNPITVLYLATVLAHRLDGANHALIQLKHQLQTGEPHSVVAKTVSKMEGLLAVGGAAGPGDNSLTTDACNR
jgi:hypothetical protein